jgi:uncharacterized protein with beta-barrel porin domain
MEGIVFGQNSFVETGGDAVDLHVLSHTTDLALSILGAEICYMLPVGQVVPLRLNGRLGWAHDFASTDRTATAFLDGTPSAASFTVLGAPAVRDAAVFGVGVAQSMPGFDLFLRYEGTAGGGSYLQGGTAGLRFIF